MIRGDIVPVTGASAYARGALATGLTSLDASFAGLDDAGLEAIVAWTPWLRELSAAGR